MVVFGNICVGLAALEVLGLFWLWAEGKGMGAVGLFFLLAVAIFLTHSALYCAIVAAGRLDAMHLPRFILYPGALVSSFCLVIFMFGAVVAAKDEPSNVAPALGFFGFSASWVVPALVPILTFFLLNHSLLPQIPLPLLRGLVFALGIVGIVVSFSMMVKSAENDARDKKARLEAYQAESAARARQGLEKVQAADPAKGFVDLLEHSGKDWPTEIRELAAKKMLSNGPKFAPLLTTQLRTGDNERALQFLLEHDVPDAAALAEPARAGMLRVTAKIRKPEVTIWATDFTRLTDLVLKVADKYSAYGVDYVPAVRDFRAALSEPVPEKSLLPEDCVKSVDAWLARKGK